LKSPPANVYGTSSLVVTVFSDAVGASFDHVTSTVIVYAAALYASPSCTLNWKLEYGDPLSLAPGVKTRFVMSPDPITSFSSTSTPLSVRLPAVSRLRICTCSSASPLSTSAMSKSPPANV